MSRLPVRPSRAIVLSAVLTAAATASTAAPAPRVATAPHVAPESTPKAAASNPKETPAVLQYTVPSLSGQPVALSKYAGKVVLIVNVASKCGFTPQYTGLESLYETYADKGFVILGFPANDFGAQEPGSNEEIATFCKKNYGVTFDMFSKISVLGDGKAPLYKWLTSSDTDPSFAGEVQWNFEKFLIGRDGKVLGRFRSKVKPQDPELTGAIEKALAQPVG